MENRELYHFDILSLTLIFLEVTAIITVMKKVSFLFNSSIQTMKRYLRVLCLLPLILTASNFLDAQASRNLVLVEVATGTWCTFCPGSSMAAHDLETNNDPVAIVKYHGGGSDPFIIPAGEARLDYYGTSAFPTGYFDGQNPYEGGSSSNSIYSSYLPRVDSAIGEPTPFDISVSWTQNGSSIDISVDVEQMGSYTGGPLVVHIAATESDIQYSWLNQTEVNNSTRAMVPNENGTPLTISQGQTVSTNLSLAIDPSWVQENMEIIAWVQDPASKVVYNTAKVSAFQPSGAYDPGIVGILNAPESFSCSESFAPEVSVRNYGSDMLGSIEFDYSITNGYGFVYSNSYTWNGTLGSGEQTSINLPVINFSPAGNNTLVVNAVGAKDVSGNTVTDSDSLNNSGTSSWEYDRDAGNYTFSLTTDDYGFETYWQVTNSTGAVVDSGGNLNVGANGGGQRTAGAGDPGAYGNNTTITETIALSGDECFQLLILDDYGDGICCDFGQGSYALVDPNGNQVIAGSEFQIVETVDWFVGTPAVAVDDLLEDDLLEDEAAIYPNPNNGHFLIKTPKKMLKDAKVTIHAMNGQMVFQAPIDKIETSVRLNNLSAGTYVTKITGAGKVVIKKLNIR